MRRVTLSLLTAIIVAIASLSFFQNCDGFTKIDRDVSSFNSESTGNIRSSSAVSATAIALFRRVAGVTPDLDDPQLLEMEDNLIRGDYEAAATVAATTPEFYNITVRDFATKMSNIAQTVDSPLNDFVATVIGTVKDNISAQDMLTENYYYRAYSAAGVASDLENDIITTNRHYRQLSNSGADLSEVLKREDGQKVINPNGSIEVLRDSAGVMTTRGWMAAHAQAGTNRRLVEYAFKIFLCSPIEMWASTNNADNRVGPDVGRLPAKEYLNKCKACHSGMDALRPATAHFDFTDGFIKYRYSYTMDPDPDDPNTLNTPVPADEQFVPSKFRRASDNFAGGYRVKNDDWSNYASDTRFGWRSRSEGSGMRAFAEMIASSEQFSRCMVERVFKSVCRREVLDSEADLVRTLASDFEDDGYLLKNLFVKVAIQPECIGLSL